MIPELPHKPNFRQITKTKYLTDPNESLPNPSPKFNSNPQKSPKSPSYSPHTKNQDFIEESPENAHVQDDWDQVVDSVKPSDLNIVESVDDMIRQSIFLSNKKKNEIIIVGQFSEDQFEADYKEVIKIDEIAYCINQILKDAELFLMEEKVVRGLYLLKKAESIINFVKAFDPEQEYHEYLVIICNNIGYFLTKFAVPNLALNYVKDSLGFLCSFITKERIRMQILDSESVRKDVYYMTVRLQQRRIQVKLLLRESVLLSEMKRHSESLEVAREAVSESITLVFGTLKLAYILVLKMENLKTLKINKMYNTKNKYYFSSKDYDKVMAEDEMGIMNTLRNIKQDQMAVSRKSKNALRIANENVQRKREKDYFDMKERSMYENLKRVIPILEILRDKLKDLANGLRKEAEYQEILKFSYSTRKIKFLPVDMEYLFSSINPESWTANESLTEIINIKLMELTEMGFIGNQQKCFEEAEPTTIVENIAWVVISMYCMATEKYFVEYDLKDKFHGTIEFQKRIESRVPDSEVDLGKTLELCYMFLPHSLPLSMQIFSVFEKTQSMAHQSIPEDTEIDMRVKLVKPLKGGTRSNFFIPLIRENKKQLMNTNYQNRAKTSINKKGRRSKRRTIDSRSKKRKSKYDRRSKTAGQNLFNRKERSHPVVKEVSEKSAIEFSQRLQMTTFTFKRAKKFPLRSAKAKFGGRRKNKRYKKFDDGFLEINTIKKKSQEKHHEDMQKTKNSLKEKNKRIKKLKKLLPLKGVPKKQTLPLIIQTPMEGKRKDTFMPRKNPNFALMGKRGDLRDIDFGY